MKRSISERCSSVGLERGSSIRRRHRVWTSTPVLDNSPRTRLWLQKDHQIHPHSMAWECLKQLDVPNKMEPVLVEAWFAHLPLELKAEILEQSVRLGRFPGILTLLWVIQ